MYVSMHLNISKVSPKERQSLLCNTVYYLFPMKSYIKLYHICKDLEHVKSCTSRPAWGGGRGGTGSSPPQTASRLSENLVRKSALVFYICLNTVDCHIHKLVHIFSKFAVSL